MPTPRRISDYTDPADVDRELARINRLWAYYQAHTAPNGASYRRRVDDLLDRRLELTGDRR